MSARVVLAGLLLAGGMLAGCSSENNERNWNQEGQAPLMSAESPASMPGRWEGSWQSNTNYDRGLAHMVITPMPAPKDSITPDKPHFNAHFTLWHYGLLPEHFDVMITTTPGVDGKLNFYGERALDASMGNSKFDGQVENNKLYLTFVSRRDYGTLFVRHLADNHVTAVATASR